MARNPGMYSYRGLRGLGQGMYQDGPNQPMRGLGANGGNLASAQANAAQRALEQRELVKANIGENVWTDLTSGKTYKISPFTITKNSLTGFEDDQTFTDEYTLGTFDIPVGTELMFAKPRFARGDIESPHIWATLNSSNTPATEGDVTNGIFRVRVFDSQNHFEKFIPLEVSVEKLNSASAIDIDQRIYYNSQTPGRAVAGDTVRFTVDGQGTSTTIDLDNSRITTELIRLSVLAG
jgi:hypothetical protein